MIKVIDNHAFGEKVQLSRILKVPNQVKHVKVRYVPDEDSEEVKRIKEKWRKMKGNRTKSV
jgi:ribosomal protein L32E